MSAIEIGRVVKPHGLHGEVKVRLHWSESDAFDRVDAVTVRRPNTADVELEIEAVRPSPPGVLLKLAGCDDRDAAEALRDAVLLVPRAALPALEPGEYYLCDLVGLEVVGPDGRVGEVVEIRSHPSVDSIVIARPDGSVVEQVLAEPWLAEVDLAKRTIVLASLEALL